MNRTVASAPAASAVDIPANGPKYSHSVLSAFKILGAFRFPGEQVNARELSLRTQIPEPMVCSLIIALKQAGAVLQHEAGLYQSAVSETDAPLRD